MLIRLILPNKQLTFTLNREINGAEYPKKREKKGLIYIFVVYLAKNENQEKIYKII